jgi:hypothetical protein
MQLNLKDSHWGGCYLGNQITLILALAKVSLAHRKRLVII